MIDLEGTTLTNEEQELLQHPLIGGVILFTRNYESPPQLSALITEIHSLREHHLLIAVDQEGGRVQRFREEFVQLPACAKLGEVYDRNNRQGLTLAEQMGWLLAAELRAVGVDFSFAPVLDLGRGISTVIADRAFHANPEIVTELARAMMRGMRQAGMMAVAKHFPGHGTVAADSHTAVPIDERHLVDLQFEDLLPFERMIRYGLAAIMPAHVIYPQIDNQPACFSARWLQDILRKDLEFQGIIFSDDLSMAGAAVVGDPLTRAQQALQAGCDMVLICNDRTAAIQIIDNLGTHKSPALQIRLMRLRGKGAQDWKSLHTNEKWLQAQQACCSL